MSNPTPQNNQPSTDSTLPILALVLAFVFAPAGVIIGHIALKQMREGRLVDTNRGLALAGVIVGWIYIALSVLIVIVYFGLFYWWTTQGFTD